MEAQIPLHRNILLIEVVDMKPRYRVFKNQKKRINAYIQALMQNCPGLHIAFCVKEHNIAEFTIKGESIDKEEMDLVHQYLRGEICADDKNQKYVPQKKPSREAWKEMNSETQRQLQLSSQRLTVEALEEHNRIIGKGPAELRQFACLPCYHWWWRTVLKNKPVSTCKGQRCFGKRYNALPKYKEFGIGRCICPTCNRTFYAYCEATDNPPCRKCTTPTTPHIHPKWRKQRRLDPNARLFQPGSQASQQAAQPAYSQAQEEQPDFFPLLEPSSQLPFERLNQDHIPPLHAARTTTPRRRQIFNPSEPHVSTGSTVSTFLSQCDFEQTGEDVLLDYDPDVDDYAVGACSFDCSDCNNKYEVLCRLVDTARCNQCNTNNNPLRWAPPRDIDPRSVRQHSCSRCAEGWCPNLVDAELVM